MTRGDRGVLTITYDGGTVRTHRLRSAEFDPDTEELTVAPVWFEMKRSGLFVWNGYRQYTFVPMHRIARIDWEDSS